MAVRLTHIEGAKSRGVAFKEHQLAHKYLDALTGIEIGAAAHNNFNLPNSINVAPEDDFEFYKDEQVKMCGAYAEVDTRWLREPPVSQFVDGIGVDTSWLTGRLRVRARVDRMTLKTRWLTRGIFLGVTVTRTTNSPGAWPRLFGGSNKELPQAYSPEDSLMPKIQV